MLRLNFPFIVLLLFGWCQYAFADFAAGFEAAKRNDFTTAQKEWRAAAEAGNREAKYNLGILYFYGKGVKKDALEALNWYAQAAKAGYPPAQMAVGDMYAEGVGVDADLTEAIQWYALAAESNHAPAQYILGAMFFEGRGVEKNVSEAWKWTRLAADAGHGMAQNNLGIMYAYGIGPTKSTVVAYALFALAEQNVVGSEKINAKENRDNIAKSMTAEEINHAVRLKNEMAKSKKVVKAIVRYKTEN